MKGNTPVYIIKPKYIFKSPFLKYDLQNPTNRQAQNEELTEYFNYGFNEDTMNIYAKLVNRTLKVLDHKKNLQYFDEPSELMRLNDQIPMDLGGFCKFYDPQVFKNDFIKTDQQLFKNFLFNTFKATYINGKQYPMLEFVKSMYRKKIPNAENQENQNQDEDNPLPSMIEQISKNLEKKYQETMKKLIEQKSQPKQVNPEKLPFKKGGKFDRSQKYQKQDKNERKPKIQIQVKQKSEQKKKQRQKRKRSSSSSSSGSSSGSSSDSSSSSQSDKDRRRRHRQKSDRDPRRSKERSKKRQRSREKKASKTSHKQSRSRHESKHQSRHGDRDKERKKDKKSHHRSGSREQRQKKYRR